MASIRVSFALTSPTKVQARTFTKTKAEERIKKEKAKKEPIPDPDSQPQEHPMKKDMSRPGNQLIGPASHWTDDTWTPDAGWFYTKAHTAWMVTTPLNPASHPTHVVLDLDCTRSTGSRSVIKKQEACMVFGITTEFCC